MGILGRIYIAHEGINAQLSLPAFKLKKFRTFLDEISFLKGVRLNIAVEQNDESFLKLTIKIKDKIVADGLDDSTFDVTQKGTHVNAKQFNELLAEKVEFEAVKIIVLCKENQVGDHTPVVKIALKYDKFSSEPVIYKLQRVSKPGLRKYSNSSDLPRVLNGLGIAIISTSKGVMTAKQAKRQNVGGEVICYVN